jgi:hypothetical protein
MGLNPYFNSSRRNLDDVGVADRLVNDTHVFERNTALIYAIANARNLGKQQVVSQNATIFNERAPHPYATPSYASHFVSTGYTNNAIVGPTDNELHTLNYGDWHSAMGMPTAKDEEFLKNMGALQRERRVNDFKALSSASGVASTSARGATYQVNSDTSFAIAGILRSMLLWLGSEDCPHIGRRLDGTQNDNPMTITSAMQSKIDEYNSDITKASAAFQQTKVNLTYTQLNTLNELMKQITNQRDLTRNPGFLDKAAKLMALFPGIVPFAVQLADLTARKRDQLFFQKTPGILATTVQREQTISGTVPTGMRPENPGIPQQDPTLQQIQTKQQNEDTGEGYETDAVGLGGKGKNPSMDEQGNINFGDKPSGPFKEDVSEEAIQKSIDRAAEKNNPSEPPNLGKYGDPLTGELGQNQNVPKPPPEGPIIRHPEGPIIRGPRPSIEEMMQQGQAIREARRRQDSRPLYERENPFGPQQTREERAAMDKRPLYEREGGVYNRIPIKKLQELEAAAGEEPGLPNPSGAPRPPQRGPFGLAKAGVTALAGVLGAKYLGKAADNAIATTSQKLTASAPPGPFSTTTSTDLGMAGMAGNETSPFTHVDNGFQMSTGSAMSSGPGDSQGIYSKEVSLWNAHQDGIREGQKPPGRSSVPSGIQMTDHYAAGLVSGPYSGPFGSHSSPASNPWGSYILPGGVTSAFRPRMSKVNQSLTGRGPPDAEASPSGLWGDDEFAEQEPADNGDPVNNAANALVARRRPNSYANTARTTVPPADRQAAQEAARTLFSFLEQRENHAGTPLYDAGVFAMNGLALLTKCFIQVLGSVMVINAAVITNDATPGFHETMSSAGMAVGGILAATGIPYVSQGGIGLGVASKIYGSWASEAGFDVAARLAKQQKGFAGMWELANNMINGYESVVSNAAGVPLRVANRAGQALIDSCTEAVQNIGMGVVSAQMYSSHHALKTANSKAALAEDRHKAKMKTLAQQTRISDAADVDDLKRKLADQKFSSHIKRFDEDQKIKMAGRQQIKYSTIQSMMGQKEADENAHARKMEEERSAAVDALRKKADKEAADEVGEAESNFNRDFDTTAAQTDMFLRNAQNTAGKIAVAGAASLATAALYRKLKGFKQKMGSDRSRFADGIAAEATARRGSGKGDGSSSGSEEEFEMVNGNTKSGQKKLYTHRMPVGDDAPLPNPIHGMAMETAMDIRQIKHLQFDVVAKCMYLWCSEVGDFAKDAANPLTGWSHSIAQRAVAWCQSEYMQSVSPNPGLYTDSAADRLELKAKAPNPDAVLGAVPTPPTGEVPVVPHVSQSPPTQVATDLIQPEAPNMVKDETDTFVRADGSSAPTPATAPMVHAPMAAAMPEMPHVPPPPPPVAPPPEVPSPPSAPPASGSGKRKRGGASPWTDFVKSIYHELKKTNPNITLAQAAKEASQKWDKAAKKMRTE